MSGMSSVASCDLDNTYDDGDAPNEHTSPSYNSASASTLSDSLVSAHLVSSSSSSFKHGTPMLLVRYLSMKVTNYVVSASRRSL